MFNNPPQIKKGCRPRPGGDVWVPLLERGQPVGQGLGRADPPGRVRGRRPAGAERRPCGALWSACPFARRRRRTANEVKGHRIRKKWNRSKELRKGIFFKIFWAEFFLQAHGLAKWQFKLHFRGNLLKIYGILNFNYIFGWNAPKMWWNFICPIELRFWIPIWI